METVALRKRESSMTKVAFSFWSAICPRLSSQSTSRSRMNLREMLSIHLEDQDPETWEKLQLVPRDEREAWMQTQVKAAAKTYREVLGPGRIRPDQMEVAREYAVEVLLDYPRTWVARNLTEEEQTALAELEAMPDQEPVETSAFMQAKVAFEQAINDAAATQARKRKFQSED